MINKKENVIGTRIGNKLLTNLTEHAQKENIKLSELMRTALLYYNTFVIEQEKIGVPIFISAKNEYAVIMEHLDRAGIEKVAEICFKNTMASFTYHRDNIYDKKPVQTERSDIPIRFFLKALKERVVSRNMQNWFENLEIRIEKNRILIAGLHEINMGFSTFLTFYFSKILNQYEYELIKEDLHDNKIILQFRQK